MEINLTALQRHDSKILKILDTASQVAVYAFNSATNEWVGEKTEAEGALFVVMRSCEPTHVILIMNRLNRENFVEAITTDLDVVENNQYLLYRKGIDKGHIRGIWFYNLGECSKIVTTIKKLLETTKTSSKPPVARLPGGPALQTSNEHTQAPDIVSMLNRAQHQYDQNTQKIRPPLAAETLTSSLTTLLQGNRSSGAPTAFTSVGMNQHTQNNHGSAAESTNSGPSLLQRLLSAPTIDGSAQGPRSPLGDVPMSSAFNRSCDMTNTSSSDISRSSIGQHKVAASPAQSNSFLEQPVLLTPADLSDGCGHSVNNATSDFMSLSICDSSPPLSEDHFQQAFVYLLQNDSNFVTNLHQAYLRSMENRRISSSKR